MKAFHGDSKIKRKYVARVKKHQELDHIIQGVYYENNNGKIRACGVGCTIESGEHDRYETELGIPTQIAHLEDAIFEELSIKEAKKFPLRFLQAVNVGADLSSVVPKLVIWQFEDKKYGIKNIKAVKEDKEAYGFCKEVVLLYKRELKGKKPKQDEYLKLYEKINGAGAKEDFTALADEFIRLIKEQKC